MRLAPAHSRPREERMSLLDSLLGSVQQRQEYQDFTQRYDQGPPWQGISDQEAYSRFQQVAPQLPPQVYQQSAHQAFERLDPSSACSWASTCSSRPSSRTFPSPTRVAW